MTAIVWTALGVMGGFLLTAVGDMVSQEVRDRLDHLPHAILRVAARRLDPAQRVALYDQVWLPDLTYVLKGDEARPVTRLFHGTRFALGILMSVRRVPQSAPEQVPQLAGHWPRIPGLGTGDILTTATKELYKVVRMIDTDTALVQTEVGEPRTIKFSSNGGEYVAVRTKGSMWVVFRPSPPQDTGR